MENTCFYYYPMSPLPRKFHMLTYNTVEAYCKAFNVHFYRIDTIDIDRITFVCHYVKWNGKSVMITIPEDAFGRYLYRNNHDSITRSKRMLPTALQSPDTFRELFASPNIRGVNIGTTNAKLKRKLKTIPKVKSVVSKPSNSQEDVDFLTNGNARGKITISLL